ncbi:MAG: DUF3592 domain-containing protein [Planctomycetaceae bacterium]|nr:DUF3592 domain-containing protein [Planctomycetaceae bacterium]
MQISLTGSKLLNRILLALVLFSIPLAIMLWGGRALIFSAYLIYLGSASAQWPKTPARITASNVVDGYGKYDKKCIAHVEYEFTVDGTRFRGETVQFGQPPRIRAQAEKIAAKYPIGAVSDVFYCPENPNLSVLESGVDDTMLAFLVIGGIFFFGGTYGLRLFYKQWQNQAVNRSGESRRL